MSLVRFPLAPQKNDSIWGRFFVNQKFFLMSSHELPFGLIFEEAAIVLLLLVYRLLLLGYVLVVSHNKVIQ